MKSETLAALILSAIASGARNPLEERIKDNTPDKDCFCPRCNGIRFYEENKSRISAEEMEKFDRSMTNVVAMVDLLKSHLDSAYLADDGVLSEMQDCIHTLERIGNPALAEAAYEYKAFLLRMKEHRKDVVDNKEMQVEKAEKNQEKNQEDESVIRSETTCVDASEVPDFKN